MLRRRWSKPSSTRADSAEMTGWWPSIPSAGGVRDTRRAMSEESTTPDLVELSRRTFDAYNRRDFDTVMSFYGRDCVWDASPWGIGTFEGTAAVRGFFEEWIGAYEEFAIEPEEILDLGNGVIFSGFSH